MKTLALAFLLFATAAIDVNTGKLADGAVETFTSGSRTVAVHKSGDTTTVRVQEGDRVDTVTIQREDGRLSIGHKDNGVMRRFIVVDRPKVVVDGIDLEPYLMGGVPSPENDTKVVPMPSPVPAPDQSSQYFYCPKDGAMLVVPHGMSPKSLSCPVDGTLMKAGVGPGRRFYLLEESGVRER